MKKLLLTLLVAFCATVGLAGLAACDDTGNEYVIDVSCGEHGSYALSEEGPFRENTTVTLTVTPDENYIVDSVTVNGKEISLLGNKYIINVTEDKTIVIAFCEIVSDEPDDPAPEKPDDTKPDDTKPDTPKTCEIIVNCSYGGNYELSKQAPYTLGDEVTLTVTPNAAHNVKSVTVNGADVTEELVGGKYTFTLSANVEISIEFSVVLTRAAYIGTWTSVASSETLPDVLVIGASSFTFNEKPYPLIAAETGFTFTVTASGETTRYALTLEEVGEEKYILVLTVTTTDATLTEYCTKDGVDYSVPFPDKLWGDWDAGPSRYPVSIDDSSLTIDGEKAVILFYNAQTKTYMFLSGGTQYTLVWNEEDETFTLTVVGDETSAAIYTRAVPLEEHLFTEFAGNFYTNGEHSVQIGENGSFTFDGTLCHVFPIDSSGQMSGYNFKRGSKLWQLFSVTESRVEISDYTDTITCYKLTGDEAYTVSVTCGDNGSYTLSAPKSGETYGGYEKVTITLSPAEGYRLNKLLVNGTDVAWAVTENAYSFYISKNSTVTIEFISENEHEPLFFDDYYNYVYTGTTTVNKPVTLQFKRDGRIIITLNGVEYTGYETDVVLNQGKKTDFTVNIEGLGKVRFLYYGYYRGYFDLNCDAFNANMTSRSSAPQE